MATNLKPLAGIRVIDITLFVTGPLTTEVLSDCGAEVIRIDTNSRSGMGSLQQSTSKLSITLNFASPRGLELLYRLVATSDILIENHAAGVLRRRGLGYDDLRKVKPDLIMLSSCMQGQTGPYSQHAASGHKLTALSGFNEIAGWPDREPGWIGAYTDFIAPRFNVIAVLAALDHRNRTGQGQYLDLSQNEAGMQFMAACIPGLHFQRACSHETGKPLRLCRSAQCLPVSRRRPMVCHRGLQRHRLAKLMSCDRKPGVGHGSKILHRPGSKRQ